MQASTLLDRLSELVQDQTRTTWTQAQLLAWVNDAQRAVVLVRPDASAVTGNLVLAGGTKQSLPAGGLRTLALIRNRGASGAESGRAIRLVDRATLDTTDPLWHGRDASAIIKEYCLDDRDPTRFWVSPPAVNGTQVEGTYSKSPANVTDLVSDIALPDDYAPALLEWCLYRCFARDSEETPNYARAAGHFQNFFNLLGVKMQADMAASPKLRAHLN